MSNSWSPVNVLRTALDRLRTDGWIQHAFIDEAGGECADQALTSQTCQPLTYENAHHDAIAKCRARKLLVRAWCELYGFDPNSSLAPTIVRLNDDPSTTFADVEAAFEKAIAKAQEGA